MTSFRRAYLLKKRLAGKLLKKKGVHGVGVGLHNPARPQKGAAIVVYAEAVSSAAQKRKGGSVRKIPIPNRVKTKTGSVPVRIVRSAKFQKNAVDNSGKFRRRIRPVIAGYSIGTADGSGTAGLIVSGGSSGSEHYILSNNHVLVNENSNRYSETLQPGGADGGRPGRDRVGQMDRFVKLSKTKPNYLDAATSKPLRRNLLKPSYAVFGTVPGYVSSYKVGDKLKKVGRTTGSVTGTVESIHTDIQVDYGDYGNLGSITFKNQSVIRGKRPVSLAGDSGSVWLTDRDNKAAAVNFAGSEGGLLSISYPVQWFMEVFGTRVGRPGKPGLLQPQRGKGKNYVYVQPLSPKTLKQIKTIKGRSRKIVRS